MLRVTSLYWSMQIPMTRDMQAASPSITRASGSSNAPPYRSLVSGALESQPLPISRLQE